MCDKKCQEMENLDAMHRAVLTAMDNREEFVNDEDARSFFEAGCQFLSSILFAKYRRRSECPLM